MKGFQVRFGEWVVRHQWGVLAATVIVVVAAGIGALRLRIVSDSRIFFSQGDPLLENLEELENTFDRDQHIFIMVSPAEGDIFNQRTLAAIWELTRQCEHLPYASRVDSPLNFQKVTITQDELAVSDWIEDVNTLTPEDIEQFRRGLLDEPLAVNNVISSDGRVASICTTVLRPGESRSEVPEIAKAAFELTDTFHQRYPDMQFHITGSIAADFAFGDISRKDLTSLVPIMLGVLVVVIGVSLRSFAPTLGTLMVIVMSMITGLGLAGWLGMTLNAASVTAPTLILTLAVADSVHIQSVALGLLRAGKSKAHAFAESLAVNLRPVFLTSITTAVGFLTMNFSDSPPFRELGNIVALGVTSAFLFSILTLPALMTVLPFKVKVGGPETVRKSCARLAEFVIHRKRLLLPITVICAILLSSGIAKLRVDDRLEDNFGKDHWFRMSSLFYDKHMEGFHTIKYNIESGTEGGICEPQYLEKLDEFAQWYRSQPLVGNVVCLSDLMKRLNMVLSDKSNGQRVLPDTREEAAQQLLLYEMSLGLGRDLGSVINVKKSSSQMVVACRLVTTRQMQEIDEKAAQWLRENAPETMWTHGTGISMIWSHIAQRNCVAMLRACLWAILLISVIIAISLRSIRLGLLSLIPNVAPVLMAFGIWGYSYEQYGLGLSIIAAMTIGIVVDDTVHFLCKYLRARRQDNSTPEEAVRYAFSAVGTAMWVTTVALVAGFCVLLFSGYRMNSDMGLMSAMTISLALAMDFFMLPTLLMRLDKT